MAAPLVIGTNITVGFNGVNYTGFVADTGDEERGAEDKPIKDENNATMTHLISDAYRTFKVTGKFLATNLATIRNICVGNTISVNNINCIVSEPTVIKFTALEAIATIACKKEDSMTYT